MGDDKAEEAAAEQSVRPPASATAPGREAGRRPRYHLSPWMRVLLFVLGWGLVAIGTVGLVLPGIQGIVTILAGIGLLSLVSRAIHAWARRGLRRWPGLLRRFERLRRNLHRRFGRRVDD